LCLCRIFWCTRQDKDRASALRCILSNYLRITIGTDAEMQRFFAALDEILGT
jgi:histidinol-phosphate/aromatic aminotransferase/cobyric acid decarboxylase-like protein